MPMMATPRKAAAHSPKPPQGLRHGVGAGESINNLVPVREIATTDGASDPRLLTCGQPCEIAIKSALISLVIPLPSRREIRQF
jgi:hypothetical protein